MRSAVGKTCLPTIAKPHSGETTVEGSSGTRRTSDPVETGLRRALTRTKARAHDANARATQTGREVPGLPERRRDRQTPARPTARSRWRGPDGKARRLASLKEGWTRGRSQDGGRARRARGGQEGARNGSSESRPFGNVEKADALRSSALLQNADGPPTQYLFTFGALAWGAASA